MAGISHQVGSDLSLGPTGDLAAADGLDLGKQRVLRRLLTNPGDYIWNLDYGAGLPALVGQPANAPAITGRIRGQMLLEAAVAHVPLPSVTVSAGTDGTVFAAVRYADAATGATQVLTAPISGS